MESEEGEHFSVEACHAEVLESYANEPFSAFTDTRIL